MTADDGPQLTTVYWICTLSMYIVPDQAGPALKIPSATCVDWLSSPWLEVSWQDLVIQVPFFMSVPNMKMQESDPSELHANACMPASGSKSDVPDKNTFAVIVRPLRFAVPPD